MKSVALLEQRKGQWRGFRVVSVDVETTGLTPDDRVISIALCQMIEGRVQNVDSKFIDPKLAFLGAFEIHGITIETLPAGDAVPFDEFAPTLREWLTPRADEVIVLAGHNVIFDALMLNNEFERLRPRRQSLPPVMLLNTKTLAASSASRAPAWPN